MIPTIDRCDLDNPKQHALWALVHLPNVGGAPTLTHPSILEDWSEHLWKAGFVYGEWLKEKADENGYIHVSQIPSRQIKFIPPVRGQQSEYNGLTRWVPVEEAEPKKTVIPDLSQMTAQEQYAVIQQAYALGILKPEKPEVDKAKVADE